MPQINPSKIVDVVMVSYERIEMTLRSLRSLMDTTEYIRVILVDNGSSAEVQDILYNELGFTIDVLLFLDKNYGLEPAKMFALPHVKSKLYVDTDNDCIACRQWLEKLLGLKDRHPEFAAISCRPQVFIGADEEQIFKNAKAIVERDFVGGSLRLMETAKVRKVGGWRTNPKDMIEANREEEHYICSKLRAKGYKVGYARDVRCYHQFGKKEWGYGKETSHYHRDQHPIPTDSMFISEGEWLKG